MLNYNLIKSPEKSYEFYVRGQSFLDALEIFKKS